MCAWFGCRPQFKPMRISSISDKATALNFTTHPSIRHRAARDRDLLLLPRLTQSKRSSRETSHGIYGRGAFTAVGFRPARSWRPSVGSAGALLARDAILRPHRLFSRRR
jgi:hypothetical protein